VGVERLANRSRTAFSLDAWTNTGLDPRPQGVPGLPGSAGAAGKPGRGWTSGPQGVAGRGLAGRQGQPGRDGPAGPCGPAGNPPPGGAADLRRAQAPAGTGINLKGSVLPSRSAKPANRQQGDAYIVQDEGGHALRLGMQRWSPDQCKRDPGPCRPAGAAGPADRTGPAGCWRRWPSCAAGHRHSRRCGGVLAPLAALAARHGLRLWHRARPLAQIAGLDPWLICIYGHFTGRGVTSLVLPPAVVAVGDLPRLGSSYQGGYTAAPDLPERPTAWPTHALIIAPKARMSSQADPRLEHGEQRSRTAASMALPIAAATMRVIRPINGRGLTIRRGSRLVRFAGSL